MVVPVKLDKIPTLLRELPQWVLWRIIDRDGGPTKVPVMPSGAYAKSSDPATWSTFDAARAALTSDHAGLGFVFRAGGGLVGIDLDGCRDPQSGAVADWARQAIAALDTYAEVSPSGTGVKLWVRAKSPLDRGRKVQIDATATGGKQAAVEVYDGGRFFAVTGWKLTGPAEPQERQAALDALCSGWFPKETAFKAPAVAPDESEVIRRARSYLARLEPAISGQGGHNATFHAACVCVLGFGLSEGDAFRVLSEWNESCQPPWSERDLARKIREASKQPGERNYLRFAPADQWQSMAMPQYVPDRPRAEPTRPAAPLSTITITRLDEAAAAWINRAEEGTDTLIELGLPGVDSAIGGGVAQGEMVVMAARPSHGKSAVALQCVHVWTANGRPVAMVSEEMSAAQLGKRTLQWLSDIPQEHWFSRANQVRGELADYRASRAPAFVIEGCRAAEVAAEQIRRAVKEHGIQCAVVDYAQLLQSPGKGRYEQVTNTSVCLRQIASETKIVLLVLAQLSREIEKRNTFTFQMSDLKESGQIEQDADVVMGLVWPWKLDGDRPVNEYQFHIAKNRNREISSRLVTCRFEPTRQRILQELTQDRFDSKRYAGFDRFNDGESF